jgi:Fe-S cluster biogenesis protein NfuA
MKPLVSLARFQEHGMPTTAEDNLLGKIDALLQQSESITDPASKKLLEETIRALMDLHGEALSRIMDRLAEHDQSGTIIDTLAGDPVISSLLLVYNLHPQSLEMRVGAALDSVRPYLASHGGSVELLGISDDGIVDLQMQGSCHGCPSSAVTLKSSIEKAIYEKAPDVVGIHVQGLETTTAVDHANNGFVPVEQLTTHVNGSGRIHLPLAPAAALSGALL